MANHPDVSSATKPRRRTRAATAKQPVSRAAAKAEVAKTAKLEEDKKKRKRRPSLPPTVQVPTIPTPLTKEVEDDEDEATDDPPRLLSPAAKRQQELERKTNKDDLCRMREAQWATAGMLERMSV